MKTIEYHLIDKRSWRRGAWNEEPDKVQWPDPDTGLPCLAVRHPTNGYWCGYVGVSEGHPLFGRSHRDADLDLDGCQDVNFAAACDGLICHTPEAGEPDHVWWFGFDCGHTFEVAPGRDARLPAMGMHEQLPSIIPMVYRNLEYVRSKCTELARGLARGLKEPKQ